MAVTRKRPSASEEKPDSKKKMGRGNSSLQARKRAAPSKLEEPPAKRSTPIVERPLSDRPRRSGRVSDTGKKSSYFEDSDGEEEEAIPTKKATTAKINGKVKIPAKIPQQGRRKSAPKVEEIEDEYEEDDAEEEQDDNEEYDDEDDGEPETKVTVVKVAPLRSEGNMAYSEDTVHKNTMLFLKDLKANNKRTWLKANDREFRRALKDWESFVETLTRKLSDIDFTIPELPTRDVIFRIYRDTRFSKDPTPYKPHFSAAWSRTGRKGPYACYYVHAEPGSCFIGGGLWHPENEAVHKLRQSIDERPRRWRRVLNDPGLKRTFLPAAAKSSDPEVALKAFAERNQDNALKTRPKGFNPEHRDLKLLKLKNYTVSTKVADNVIFGPGSQEKITNIFRDMVGFVTFLNSVVMPDPNMSDDESDEDEDEAENFQGSGDDVEGDEGDEDDEDDEDDDE